MSQKAEMGRGCVVSNYVFKAQWGKGEVVKIPQFVWTSFMNGLTLT